MTNEQILKKAIEKAISNGWQGFYPKDKYGNIFISGIPCEMSCAESDGSYVYTTIFNHDFARTFWGEEKPDYRCEDCFNNGYTYCSVCRDEVEGALIRWQYHLQKMVLEEEPIKYLEKFL